MDDTVNPKPILRMRERRFGEDELGAGLVPDEPGDGLGGLVNNSQFRAVEAEYLCSRKDKRSVFENCSLK
jgi:hypothetical protein